MKYIGFDCGKFRLPIKNVSDEDYRKFSAEVDELQMGHLFSLV
jgi:N-acetylneuraminate lyase